MPRPHLRFLQLLSFVLSLALGSAGHCDELADVQRLHYAGKTEAALQRADEFLVTRPKDAQMRFMRGVMLADANRAAEATAVFERLIEDYPDLAEPYNNLAALQAGNGDIALARATLDQAVRANPGYATARENLGDVYAALAAQSYARAIELDPLNTTAAPKLAVARSLVKPSAPRAPTAQAPIPPAPK